ncbi:MAG TPA: terminase family protein [Pirellulales bacterium]
MWNPAPHLTHLTSRLLDVAAGRVKRLMILMPPRHGKSQLTSWYFPAWYLGSRPDARLVLASYEADFAATWGAKARAVLDGFGEPVFGVRPAGKPSSGGRWNVAGRRGGMLTTGVGGPLTGYGADLLIIDDPVKNAEEAISEAIREKHWDWWQSTASTRLEPGGAVVLIQTRWHEDDLAGRLLAQSEKTGSDWSVVRLPALAEANDALGRSPGEALWPARWPREALEEVRRNKDLYWWLSLYQQTPGRHERAEWPADYFGEHLWVAESDWPSRFDLSVVALDPSQGESDRSDYSAIVFLGVSDGLIYIDADLERRPVTPMVQAAIRMALRYRAQILGVETNQFQELLLGEFTRQGRENRQPLPTLCGIDNRVPKTLRIRRLGPYLARRELRFRADSPGARLVVEQLKEFPLSRHDDGPDALELALRLPIEMAGGAIDEGHAGVLNL